MLLTSTTSQDTTKLIFEWLELHPQTVSIITTLIQVIVPCLCFRQIIVFLLKPYIDLRNKRIEAETDFYPILRLRINVLKGLLENHHRLECQDRRKGNIFSLLYKESVLFHNCPTYDRVSQNEIRQYWEATQRIKDAIDNSKANIPPKNSQKNKWESSLKDILLFCSLMESKHNNEDVQSIAEITDSNSIPPHIKECNRLIDSMDYLSRDFKTNPDKNNRLQQEGKGS